MQVSTDGALDVAHAAGGLLDQAAGLDVDVDLDAGQARGDLVEGRDAVVRDALGDVPLDALVGALLLDLGGELAREEPDLRLELEVRLVVLADALDPVHELGPLLELREVVVGRGHRDADVDRLLDGHAPALADTGLGALATTTTAAGAVAVAVVRLLVRVLILGHCSLLGCSLVGSPSWPSLPPGTPM